MTHPTNRSCWLWTLVPLWAFCLAANAQPTYHMANLTVSDCEGILYDSDNGDIAGTYDHNENYVFRICVPDVDAIVLSFQSFCTELGFDSLAIYDGPDTLSILLGVFSGEDEPPALSATSGCMTLHFRSDVSVACTGWVAQWHTEYEIPAPVPISTPDPVPCESTSLVVTFAEPVPCDSLTPASFTLNGPQPAGVQQVVPLDCTGGWATMAELVFSDTLAFGGSYELSWITSQTICGTTYLLQSDTSFSMIDCPLELTLELESGTLCPGDTAVVVAHAQGGNPSTYAFYWNLPGADSNRIATVLTDTTHFEVTLTDGLVVVQSDLIVVPEAMPLLLPADTTLCQSDSPFVWLAVPAGGTWSGAGFADEEDPLYDPARTGGLTDTIWYTSPAGCRQMALAHIIPLDVGTDDGTCPAADSFLVSGGLPAGGTWSGPFISVDGWFHPPDTVASFTVTYTHPNGCSGSKQVHVGLIAFPPLDSVCQSEPPFPLEAQPAGGTWSGPGITDDPAPGTFDPDEAGPGSHELVYEVNGCSDTMPLTVIQIDARGNFSACPEQAPFIVPGNWQPQGTGIWSGIGIIDSLTGLYDPSLLPNGSRDTLWLTANGCTDFRIAFIRKTEIQLTDTLAFCPEDEALPLDRDHTGIRPRNGDWWGAGVTQDANDDYFFEPAVAGPGLHTLYYERNTCVDSMHVRVWSTPQISRDTFCDSFSPQALEVDLDGGTWAGNGIINDVLGIFDPTAAGAGTHAITYTSAEGCTGTGEVVVEAWQEAQIEGVEPFYCYRDTQISIQLLPTGGQLLLDGLPANATLNPAQAGPGPHQLTWTAGPTQCPDSQTIPFEVGQPVTVSVPTPADTLCYGQEYTLIAQGSGGSSMGNLTYHWDHGLGFGQAQYVQPQGPTTYTVSVSDGCSDPATASIHLYVHPPLVWDYALGDTVCFGDTTWAEAWPAGLHDYRFEWIGADTVVGSFYEAPAGTVTLVVTDTVSGCRDHATLVLPGYAPVVARFEGVLPDGACLTLLEPQLQLLDYSQGATAGWWDFGDGSDPMPWLPGQAITHTWTDTGTFIIRLHLMNEGGCTDEWQQPLCVEPAWRLHAPNALTPNGDGINDLFQLRGMQIEDITWYVFDRYGTVLFTGHSLDDVWDGTFRGQRLPMGTYVWKAVWRPYGANGHRTSTGFVTVVY